MSDNSKKLCRECRWCSESLLVTDDKCKSPKTKGGFEFCETQRLYKSQYTNDDIYCGESGRLFESKRPSLLKRFLIRILPRTIIYD